MIICATFLSFQTRNRFEGTRSEVESLMKKMKENPLEHKTISPYTMEGYLYVQEKRKCADGRVGRTHSLGQVLLLEVRAHCLSTSK